MSKKIHYSNTRESLPITAPLSRDTYAMTIGSNAGIKRNRRPFGSKNVERKIFLAPETDAALAEARMASGRLSISLYLERLIAQLEEEKGSLPILSPDVDSSEVRRTTAA